MKLKISKLTCTFVFSCLSILSMPQAVYAMHTFEEAAEEATRTNGSGKNFNFHAHNYIINGQKPAAINFESLGLKELMYLGAQQGVMQGTSQVVASLIVELTQLSILKGAEFFLAPSKEEQQKLLQAQQLKTEMLEGERQLKQLQNTITQNGPAVSSFIDGATKLNDEQAKKLALVALMKYGNQLNVLLDVQNQMLGMPTEKAIPTR